MTNRISHSYFIVMIDFGQRGLEATVQPEITRREVVARIKSGEYQNIAFIHHVDGLLVEDVTDELFDEAETEVVSAGLAAMGQAAEDRKAAVWDRARDLRKHEVA